MDCKMCESMKNAIFGNILDAWILPLLIAAVIVAIAVYIYTSFAWMTIGRKLKYKNSWLAWIPIANIAMILQMGKFNWKWIFLVLVPILGWLALAILCIIATWRIYKKRKYPGWLVLIPFVLFFPCASLIASLVILGLVAWKNR